MLEKNKPKSKSVEHEIQKQIISWLNLQYKHILCKIIHIPNEQQISIKNKEQAYARWNKLKALGCEPGVSDLLILFNHGISMWLEIKKAGGRLSDKQKKFHDDLQQGGHNVFTAFSFDHARIIIDTFVKTFLL